MSTERIHNFIRPHKLSQLWAKDSFLYRLFSPNTLFKRLLIPYLLTGLLVGGSTVYNILSINIIVDKLNATYASNAEIFALTQNLQAVQTHTESYLSTKSSTALQNYYKASAELTERAAALNDRIVDFEPLLLERNINRMIATYSEETELAIAAKRGRDIVGYTLHYDNSSTIFRYIQNYADRLNEDLFRLNYAQYQTMDKLLDQIQLLDLIILTTILAINFVIVLLTAIRITRPVAELAQRADLVASGNLDVAPIDVDTHDEVHTLANAFNAMIVSIRDYVAQIRDNLIRETRQKEHDLVMENLLQVAQLKNLQAQINPHFLFNALNTGAQMAMLEGADRTSDFVEHVADFYRYNIKLFDRDVTLGEELKMAQDYIYIQKVRFAERIHYNDDIDTTCLDVRMPGLILQPLVENALNHGLRDAEEGGQVTIIVRDLGELVEVLVRDNGRGMDSQKIATILATDPNDPRNLTLTNQAATGTKSPPAGAGIALTNVVNRLRLYYHRQDVIEIVSGPTIRGTTIKLLIPKLIQEGEHHV
ncbi:MAG: histidine kinase [Eubacteriales bacterium]|nr:histidine kinase [Eubacteriales bacterium]